MVAPTLTSDHPGLEVLAEVAKVLAAGRGGSIEEGLAGVAGVLRRGLSLRRCHLWLRSADGTRYLPSPVPKMKPSSPALPRRWRPGLPQGPIANR
jgi:hypothetical protein